MEPTATTRRGFLALAGSTTALGALAGLRTLPAAAVRGVGAAGFFSADETEILTAVVERMVETGEPDAPAVRETAAVETIDRLCAGLDPALTSPLPWLLRAVDYGPILFDFSFARFRSLDAPGRDAALRSWMTSRFGFRRMGFEALRNLAFLGYYSQPSSWRLIGYAGPLWKPEGTA